MSASLLRQAMKRRFYPFAESRGFVRAKSKNTLSVQFSRLLGTEVEAFDIQWDKYHRPRFVINFEERCPMAASATPGMHQGGHRGGRLQRRKGGSLGCWFQLRKPLLETLVSLRWKYDPDEVVDSVISTFPEVEAWWANKTVGRHLYFWWAR